ncbi:peptidase S66 [Thermaurantimonas aggregans]|uniref:Peptidase S66 n=1 Tax=Thermaurantimonas aggregans TaxID=2173829 RepID=A0A401XII2_9FLAO|nr:LD-carboxypeptidase [Thermaurantimonas aggregans]MCX8148746.1 LD-carboxypeptidase [Thermaurantimonas aggregans]GCD76803.1 peptidase S66 [Thermaurantimonas aggregans]
MFHPPLLRSGDTIYITAPARAFPIDEVQYAIHTIEKFGFKAIVGNTIGASYHQWSATDSKRAADVQTALNNPEVKALFMARGGYGCVRIIDEVDFSPLQKHPKWMVGFSDVTVFHAHLWSNFRLASLHAPMIINFKENTEESIQSIFHQLTTGVGSLNGAEGLPGYARGPLVGGNLSVLYSLLGSRSFPDLQGVILMLEDLDEYLYHIDRMLFALKRAGVLEGLAGLVIGSFTKMHDNQVPFGYTVREIFLHHFANRGIPLAFGANIGHHTDQRAFIHGADAVLEVDSTGNWQLQWQLT